MKTTPEKLAMLKMLCVTSICFAAIFVWAMTVYFNATIPKTREYYMNQTFEECINSIESNGIFRPDQKQVILCRDVAREIYHEKP